MIGTVNSFPKHLQQLQETSIVKTIAGMRVPVPGFLWHHPYGWQCGATAKALPRGTRIMLRRPNQRTTELTDAEDDRSMYPMVIILP